MPLFENWQDELNFVDSLMKRVSLESDPNEMVRTYVAGIRQIFPADRWISISRRGLDPPYVRITRSTLWQTQVDPWKEKARLPILDGGTLSDLLYRNQPCVELDFHADPSDPAYEHLAGARSLMALPQYDNGESLNMAISMWNQPGAFDPARVPGMLWQANLFGRATHNMVLRQELGAAYAAIDRELQAVGAIQRSLLPTELPVIPRLSLAAFYETSQRAGGDFYDVFPLPDGQWGILIGDVSGHGTPAAVMMAVTHTLAHSHPGPPVPPRDVLRRLNAILCSRYTRGNGTFITAFYAVFDPRNGELRYACAGHNPPRVRRAGAVLELGETGGLPLGVVAESDYPEASVALRSGDVLFLYTDGIVEAFSASGEMFDTPRLDRILLAAGDEPETIISTVNCELRVFVGDRPLSDDRTMLVGRVN
ncbi:MAG: PP2C family protein-serine/threonine phosphatase [Phycisphaerales bacterium]|nr:PP2C family protein-serine/threonine phosphatase [Phycisphaerales bacterium]